MERFTDYARGQGQITGHRIVGASYTDEAGRDAFVETSLQVGGETQETQTHEFALEYGDKDWVISGDPYGA